MKIIAILCFAAGALFLFLAITQVVMRGWGPLDVSVFDFYFVVLPIYLLLTAGSLIAAGLIATLAPHS